MMQVKCLEADLKSIAINYMIHNSILEKTNTIINEFTIGDYTRRVDLAVVKSNRLYAYEIKSEADTLVRLPGQIESYLEYFDKVTVISARKHIKKILEMAPQNVEVWEIHSEKLNIIRRGKTNIVTDKLKFLELMTVVDLIKIARAENVLLNSYRRNAIQQRLIYLPKFKLRKYALEALQERYKSTNSDFFQKVSERFYTKSEDLYLLRSKKVEKLDAKLDVNDLLEALQNLEDELFPLSST